MVGVSCGCRLLCCFGCVFLCLCRRLGVAGLMWFGVSLCGVLRYDCGCCLQRFLFGVLFCCGGLCLV